MKIITFFFTLLFLVLYSLVGGAIFMLLEQDTEKEFKSQVNKTVHEIMDNNQCIPEKDILSFQKIVMKMRDASILMKNDSTTFYRSKFDFRSSIMIACCYFSGFGLKNMSPITIGGKVFNVFYLIFAIYYLFFITYASSEVINVILTYILSKIRKKEFSKNIFILIRQLVMICIALVLFFLVPAAIIHEIETWTFLETLYFCLVYLITLGFLDYLPGDMVIDRSENFIQWYRFCVGFWILFATLWVGIIMIQYSWIIGFFFWETTDMMINENIDSMGKIMKKKSKTKAMKDFIKQRKEAWRVKRQGNKRNIASFPTSPPELSIQPRLTEAFGRDFLPAETTSKFMDNPKTPEITTGKTNIIQVSEFSPVASANMNNHFPLSPITYPSLSSLNQSARSLATERSNGIINKINV